MRSEWDSEPRRCAPSSHHSGSWVGEVQASRKGSLGRQVRAGDSNRGGGCQGQGFGGTTHSWEAPPVLAESWDFGVSSSSQSPQGGREGDSSHRPDPPCHAPRSALHHRFRLLEAAWHPAGTRQTPGADVKEMLRAPSQRPPSWQPHLPQPQSQGSLFSYPAGSWLLALTPTLTSASKPPFTPCRFWHHWWHQPYVGP